MCPVARPHIRWSPSYGQVRTGARQGRTVRSVPCWWNVSHASTPQVGCATPDPYVRGGGPWHPLSIHHTQAPKQGQIRAYQGGRGTVT